MAGKVSNLKQDEDIYRLEGSSSSDKGGLVVMKKEKVDESDVFKKPQVPGGISLLGLDRLAKLKRENKEKEQFKDKRIKLAKDDDDEESSFRKDSSSSRKSR